jgi:hypothetical protein
MAAREKFGTNFWMDRDTQGKIRASDFSWFWFVQQRDSAIVWRKSVLQILVVFWSYCRVSVPTLSLGYRFMHLSRFCQPFLAPGAGINLSQARQTSSTLSKRPTRWPPDFSFFDLDFGF